jgi:glutamine synthetase
MVRSVAPDIHPYLWLHTLLRIGREGVWLTKVKNKRERLRFLPGTLSDALKLFKLSGFVSKIKGDSSKEKFANFKQLASDRSPKALGTRLKNSEVVFLHEVTNQALWNTF